VIHKMSLIASTLGLTVVGAGVEQIPTPIHLTHTELSAAYQFESVEACQSQIDALYRLNKSVKGKLKCVES